MNEDTKHTITGKYLHNLSDTHPDEDTLQKMIGASPSSLSYTHDGELPIHSASWCTESIRYVPLLAIEGIKHKIGGTKEQRGGLTMANPSHPLQMNVLESLTSLVSTDDPVFHDQTCVDVMKKLKKLNLFKKEDIKNYHLLIYACRPNNQLRFEYIAGLDPKGLKNYKYVTGLPIIHAIIQYGANLECFSTFLPVAIKHHPRDLGLLFQKDDDGTTAYEAAVFKYGKVKVMEAIGKCIPFHDPKLPILHHVAKHAPDYLNDFAAKYQAAFYYRDSDNRTLHQARLASGWKDYERDPMFFFDMSDDQIWTIDPGTSLYPFAVLASGETSDLSAVYHVLRRNPSLI